MKQLQHILSEWMRKNGYRTMSEAAIKNGFPKSSFRDWASGHSVPKIKAQREKLFKLTGSPLLQGPLTAELKMLSLAPYDPDSSEEERVNRLAHMMIAMIPDLRWLTTTGSVLNRERLRSLLTEEQHVEFSTRVRGIASEDALRLLQKELGTMKGGGR
jgi:hypothetical protein